MKCPKCHYLSFEPEPRCRNCGYDLALADADLAMREFESEEPATPAADLPLHQDLDEPETVAAAPRSLRDRLHPAAEPSRGGTVLDLPTRPRAPRRPRPVSPISTETRTARTAAAAARVAALDTPVPAHDLDFADEPPPMMPIEPQVDDRPALDLPRDFAAEAAAPLDVEPASEASPFLPPPAPIDRPADPPIALVPELPRHATSRVPTSELPLFVKGMADSATTDEELLGRAAAPRAPLGVRRSVPEPVPTPVPPPVAGTPEATARPAGAFDRDLIDDLARIERDDARQARADARALVRAAEIRANGDAASPVLRLAAASVDLAVVAGLGLAVVALTLRVCGLSFVQSQALPVLPLAAFLLLVGAAYLMLFTMAGGQTIGKMTFGLRTVDEAGTPDHREPMTMNQAASRALLTVPSVLALGIGFLPALVGDRRAVHDRLAHTRVVRA